MEFSWGPRTPRNKKEKARREAERLKEAKELSLTANQNASAIRARRAAAAAAWRAEGGAAPPPHAWRSAHFDWATNATVALGPLEIKTFELTI